MAKEIAKIFDIECERDDALLEKCFKNEWESDSLGAGAEVPFLEWVQDRYAEGANGDFFPLIFHKPVVISVGAAFDDGSLLGPMVMKPIGIEPNSPSYSKKLVEMWWEKCEAWIVPLVSYNGRGYDLPVLEMWAMRYGIECPGYFEDSKKSYRHRYGRHIDLMDQLSNHGAVRRVGKLDWILKAIGDPGKDDIDGTMVDKFWKDGHFELVESYCNDDVRRTHYLFERWRKVTGWSQSGTGRR